MTVDQGTRTASVPAGADPRRAVEIFYDGACPVCRAEIGAVRAAATAPAVWRDVSGEGPAVAIEAGRAPVERARLLERFHVRRADGVVVSGAAAFFALWRLHPRLSWFARLVDRQPIVFFGNLVYGAFLKIRRVWRSSPER